MNERERRISEKLGFRIFQAEVVADDTHLIWMKMGIYMGFASEEEVALWRELLSTTEQLERIRKAAQEYADASQSIPNYDTRRILETLEALRKELL